MYIARILRILAAAVALLAGLPLPAQQDLPDRAGVLRALRQAVDFYRTKVSTEGGYHYDYVEDLSYGRSEHGEGPTQVEVQREATPGVGMACLAAYEATGDRFHLEAARAASHALVRGQLCSGGWDYYIEFDPSKRKNYGYRADVGCTGPEDPPGPGVRRPVTNLDDNTTQGAVRLLMRVDRDLEFRDKQIHEAARFALDSLVRAQYPNGAWPQRYNRFPDPSQYPEKRASYPASWPRKWPGANYQAYYTFNDNTISDTIDMMLEAARIYNERRYRAAAEKGGDFILLAQMPEPQPAWAQQYDINMQPAWARMFEPPSVTGGESQGIMKTLLVLCRETGNRKYLEPIPRALAYLRRSALPKTSRAVRPRARPSGEDSLGDWGPRSEVLLARFYELETNRPLYITKGTRINVKGGGSTTVDGYELSYSDESVITHYAVVTSGHLLDSIEQEYKAVLDADTKTLRRPDRLKGLSPWSATPRSEQTAAQLAARVRKVLAASDPRGAWVEEGVIGKADRLVSLFAARDMVVSVGGQTYPLKENQTLEVFQGPEPPRQRIIRSRTFLGNVETLAAYLTATKP